MSTGHSPHVSTTSLPGSSVEASVPVSPAVPRTRSRSPPGRAPMFQPNLPPLPTPSEVPIVRKRKASQDLTSNPLPKESKVELVDVDYSKDETVSPPSQPTAEEEKAKKLRNVGTRTLWTLIMISGFLSRFFFNYLCFNSAMVFFHSFTCYGTCIHDTACNTLPVSCLPRGHVAVHASRGKRERRSVEKDL